MMYSSFPYNKPVPSYWVLNIPYIFHRITRAAYWPERPNTCVNYKTWNVDGGRFSTKSLTFVALFTLACDDYL